ncbi:MAG: hypothetical protein A2X82_07495 [Geobacteraceae bacterium GWC2_55_20]|nr:MAG: hypothetical protein A2X82_07495 [Geobacteraceae bacterium GWC2_55_20]OGU18730.1 MAG: hypothetical protein A2X85_01205 [Geobacteraceae bacterium GWF2_54_21]
MGLIFAELLLVKRQEPYKADVIVLLGGENVSRVEKAAALYQAGYAPTVLVTGKNEAELMGVNLIAAGVPESAILFEPAASSTFENALFSIPVLKQRNMKNALLVTSWFHSRRATAVFESRTEKINFFSVPTDGVPLTDIFGNKRLLESVLREYVKIFGYWLKYGVASFG